jgi:uncharacterized protein (DUF3084 family)
MATADPHDTADQAPRKRNPSIWISALLVIVAAGLVIWALTIRSDLDDTQQELAATQQDLEEAEKTATQAEQDAEAAKQATADAGTETEKVKAQADQATADVKAAQSRAAVAADCAKAYISAFGALFEGDSARDQAPAVREQLSGITSTCKDELAGP